MQRERGFWLRSLIWLFVAVAAAVTLAVSMADAAPVTYEWEGVVSAAESGSGLAPGDAIRGIITFPDEAVNPNQSPFPGYAAFSFDTAVNFGGVSYTGPTGGWGVGLLGQNNQDSLLAGTDGSDAHFNYNFIRATPEALAYSSVATLADDSFTERSWYAQVRPDTESQPKEINGVILKIARVLGAPAEASSGSGDAAPTPEPSSLALFGIGVIGLGVLRKKKASVPPGVVCGACGHRNAPCECGEPYSLAEPCPMHRACENCTYDKAIGRPC